MPSSAGACRCYPGDTLSVRSTVLGLRENSNRKSGVVWVRSTGINQRDEMVLDYMRWVMVHKRDRRCRRSAHRSCRRPRRPSRRPIWSCRRPLDRWATTTRRPARPIAGRTTQPGERIDHVSGITLEDSDHMFSTRLYQNTARVHFDADAGKTTRFGRRLAYGGHVISLARALSFNGLANGFRVAAINGGSHVGPTFGGDTIYAWSEVLETAPLPAAIRPRRAAGAHHCRPRTARAATGRARAADGKYHPAVVLDLDYWLLMPRRCEFRCEIRDLTQCRPTFVDLRARALKTLMPQTKRF